MADETIVERKNGEQAAAKPRKILCFGDSLTAGYGIDPALAYPALLQEKLRAAGYSHVVINAGVSGETTAGGLRRIDWVLREPYEIIILELGANDGLRGFPVEQTYQNLKKIIEAIRSVEPAPKVLLAGMRVPTNMGQEYEDQFFAIYERLAKEYQTARIPFFLEGVAGDKELNLPDGIHPNAEGYKIIAENVWGHLEEMLEDAEADSK